MSYERPVIWQGNAVPLSDEDQKRDDIGFTNPNLHRRVDPHMYGEEVQPREYDLFISNLDSYRTTKCIYRNPEDNTDTETP